MISSGLQLLFDILVLLQNPKHRGGPIQLGGSVFCPQRFKRNPKGSTETFVTDLEWRSVVVDIFANWRRNKLLFYRDRIACRINDSFAGIIVTFFNNGRRIGT